MSPTSQLHKILRFGTILGNFEASSTQYQKKDINDSEKTASLAALLVYVLRIHSERHLFFLYLWKQARLKFMVT